MEEVDGPLLAAGLVEGPILATGVAVANGAAMAAGPAVTDGLLPADVGSVDVAAWVMDGVGDVGEVGEGAEGLEVSVMGLPRGEECGDVSFLRDSTTH